MERYIILEVTYVKGTDYGRSLGWVAPALKDAAGLTMTEDYTGDEFADSGDEPSRKWAGIVTGDEWDALVLDWSIDPDDSEANMGMLTEYGHLEAQAYNWDGMDWNVGGETPIAYVSLYVSIPKD